MERERVMGRGRGVGREKKALHQKFNSGCAILSCFNCLLKSCLYIPMVHLCSWNIEHRATSVQLSKEKNKFKE